MLPHVWPKAEQLAVYAYGRDMGVKINTNGTHRPDLSNLIPERTLIQVSIDGPEEIHDQYRGTGVYKKAVEFIELVKSKGFSCEIKSVLLDPATAKDVVKNTAALAKKHKTDSTVQLVNLTGRGVNWKGKPEVKEKDVTPLVAEGMSFKGFIAKCHKHLGVGGSVANIDEEGFFIPCSQLRHLKSDINILDPNYSEIRVRFALKRLTQGITCSC